MDTCKVTRVAVSNTRHTPMIPVRHVSDKCPNYVVFFITSTLLGPVTDTYIGRVRQLKKMSEFFSLLQELKCMKNVDQWGVIDIKVAYNIFKFFDSRW